MRHAHKLLPVPAADIGQPLPGRYAEGEIIGMAADGTAVFRDESGESTHARVPRHVDRRWLAAAVALAPVPAIVLSLASGRAPVVAHVFATPAHAVLDEEFRVDAKVVELSASESIRIRTGRSIVTVTAAGDVQVRGRNITSRASNVNRIRGGAVKIN
jgi:predicted secreted protein